MKQTIFVLFFILFSVYCRAQDIIVTNDGVRIECIIKSQTEDQISYTEWKDKKNVLKIISMSSVWSVALDENIKREVVKPSQYAVPYSYKNGSGSFNSTAKSYSAFNKVKNPERIKCIAGGITGCVLYFPLFMGSMFGGIMIDEWWGYTLMGVGIVGAITSLSCGIKALSKASAMPKYACVMDVPLNDGFSIGLYDYAYAPTQFRGAGIGVKFRF